MTDKDVTQDDDAGKRRLRVQDCEQDVILCAQLAAVAWRMKWRDELESSLDSLSKALAKLTAAEEAAGES